MLVKWRMTKGSESIEVEAENRLHAQILFYRLLNPDSVRFRRDPYDGSTIGVPPLPKRGLEGVDRHIAGKMKRQGWAEGFCVGYFEAVGASIVRCKTPRDAALPNGSAPEKAR